MRCAWAFPSAAVRGSMGRRLLRFLVRRVAFGVVTVFLTACFAYGMIRLLRPETYGGGQNLLVGTWQDVIHELQRFGMHGADLKRDWASRLVDVYLLAGAVVVAVGLGVGGGLWCAARPRSRASRALESVAMLFLCAPPYVVALLLLLLFASWGTLPLPFFFEVHVYASPTESLWTFFRAMLIPWFVVGAPLAAQFLRLTLTLTIDAMGEEWVRTAMAKGVPHKRVVSKHAGPSARLAVASLFGASAPILVTNMVLVESVWSVPGLFVHMRRALGQGVGGDQSISISAIQSLSVWAAVLIVALSLLADLAIVRLDPRVRARGGTVG